ncbi:MAG: hypothetical protein HC884_05745 [Chloroflexaceae bacterium]|nr:hypothetical protein [Chloroflexaceae bacterium]
MQRQTQLSIWCERIIEGGWLLALTLIPIYFNLLSARHFEPDKATTLRSIVLVMAAVALVRAIDTLMVNQSGPGTPRPPSPSHAAHANSLPEGREPASSNPLMDFWRQWGSIPLAVPTLVYALVFLLATIVSVVPYTSFWGSYQRLQGTYTNLSYVLLGVLIVATLRRREQLERLITVVLIAGLVVAFYGIAQNRGLDPLPWKGDVTTRVASTMGNSIFVAAYLILVVPFALYRVIGNITRSRKAPSSPSPLMDGLWAVSYALLIFGTISLLVSAVKFGAVVRVADFRYWWVFPGAVALSTALWVLPTLNLQHRDRLPFSVFLPGGLFLGYLFLLGPMFALSAGSDTQKIDQSLEKGLDWWVWLLASAVAVAGFYALAFFLPRRAGEPSRITLVLQALGSLVVTAALLLTIFYSQSRGPWLGLLAGLFVFFSLSLWLSWRRARRHNPASRLARGLLMALWGWGFLVVAWVVFLVAFNLSDAPFFDHLRKVPYFGRAGTLLDASAGTGLVRKLIWFGDEHGSGTVGLITADPARTVVGWGPESMFVAFNPFYPPSLANVEMQTASPDRSHDAMLDELATKGLLGLISYFFVLISVASLGWRIMLRSEEWQWQFLVIACLSGVTAHFVEGFTGIPIVSTLTMLWVTMALLVIAGMMAGHYTLTWSGAHYPESQDTAAISLAKPTEPAGSPGSGAAPTMGSSVLEKDQPPRNGEAPGIRGREREKEPARTPRSRGRRSMATAPARQRTEGATRRGSASASVGPRGRVSLTGHPLAALVYALVVGLALVGVWKWNINPIYADMRFHEGEGYSAQPGIDGQIYGLSKYIEAIRHTPHEDFYYLNLGRNLMEIARAKRESAEGSIGEAEPQASVETLLQLEDIQAVVRFVQTRSPLAMMSYAEAVLQRAFSLNPLNKDHSANLARINNFWYNWTRQEERLDQSVSWYEEATKVAPYDVLLLDEHASIHVMLGNMDGASGNQQAATSHYEQAAAIYEKVFAYNQRYTAEHDIDKNLAEVYRRLGRMEQATAMYVHTIKRSPQELNDALTSIVASLEGHPDLILQLRDAYADQAEGNAALYSAVGLLSVRGGDLEGAAQSYAHAIEEEPENVQHRLNYSLVLSDARQYTRALTESQEALSLARGQEGHEQEVAQLQFFIASLQQIAANPGTRGAGSDGDNE